MQQACTPHTHTHEQNKHINKCLIEYSFSTAAPQVYSTQGRHCQGLCLPLWERLRAHGLKSAVLDN